MGDSKRNEARRLPSRSAVEVIHYTAFSARSAGATIPSLMRGRLAAGWAHRPRELRRAMRTARAGGESIKQAAAAIRTAGPLHPDARRVSAGRTDDVGADFTRSQWRPSVTHLWRLVSRSPLAKDLDDRGDDGADVREPVIRACWNTQDFSRTHFLRRFAFDGDAQRAGQQYEYVV